MNTDAVIQEIKAAALADGVPEHVIDKALEEAKNRSTEPQYATIPSKD